MNRRKTLCLFWVVVGMGLIASSAWGAAGDLLWEKPLTFLPQYNTITISNRGLSATTYIITGYASNANGTGGQLGFIKAFDVTTGNIKWEQSLTLGANINQFGSIEINGDIALVRGGYSSFTGSPGNYTFTLHKACLRAYNTDTGAQLWEALRDFEMNPTSQTPSSNTVTGNNRTFIYSGAVSTNGMADLSTAFVRAYQVRNIALQNSLLFE